jgi:hypothetical protein
MDVVVGCDIANYVLQMTFHLNELIFICGQIILTQRAVLDAFSGSYVTPRSSLCGPYD